MKKGHVTHGDGVCYEFSKVRTKEGRNSKSIPSVVQNNGLEIRLRNKGTFKVKASLDLPSGKGISLVSPQGTM